MSLIEVLENIINSTTRQLKLKLKYASVCHLQKSLKILYIVLLIRTMSQSLFEVEFGVSRMDVIVFRCSM